MLAALAACGGGGDNGGPGPGTPTVARVDVTPSSVTIVERASATVSVTPRDAAGNAMTRNITWQSGNTLIATVTAAGAIVGVSAGATTIDAIADGVRGTVAVTVRQVPVGTVALTLAASALQTGQTSQGSAVVTDSLGLVVTNREVTWTLSNTAIATVTGTGLVTAVAPGTASITATAEGKSGSANVTVSLPPVATLTMAPTLATPLERGTIQLNAIARDAAGNALPRTITWTSDNALIATVSATGLVTAVSEGTTTIDAGVDALHAKATIMVRRVPVGTVVVALANAQLFPGGTTNATATLTDSLGVVATNRAIAWSSSNTAIATVSAAGLVTAIAAGNANITATSEGKTGNAVITVAQPPVASVTASASDVGITVGATSTVTATMRDAFGNILAGRASTFASSTPSVATVNQSGVVTGLSAGQTTITITSEGRTATSIVQVRAANQPWIMRDSVLVLEYPSVYSVHAAHNPALYPNMRVQPAPWDMATILPDIEKLVVPTNYDFVLLFSLREVPGWINSGSRYERGGINLGLTNSFTFTRPPQWGRLRAAPHMNNLDFFDSTAVTGSTQSPLTIVHELGHQWSAYFTSSQCAGINRLSDWVKGVHSTACLATITSHWTYLWTRAEGAGILYSGATSPRFNEFDLYAMGLMGYNEVRTYTHMVHEDKFPYTTAPQYPVTIDTLISAIAAGGPTICQGNCRRVPDTDPTVQSMRILLVIVKGADEQITEARRAAVLKLARTFPGIWNTATLGRSTISVDVLKKP